MRFSNSTAQAVAGADQEPPSPPADEAGSCIELEMAAAVSVRVDPDWIRQELAKAAGEVEKSCGRPIERLVVRIVGDGEMTRLHKEHLGIDSTTDVLTFDHSGPGKSPIEADLAIGADEAARRAAEFGHSIERELLLYALHGLLHCAGYDDHREADAAAMHAQEDRILQAIGVGAVYRPHSQSKIQNPESKIATGGDLP